MLMSMKRSGVGIRLKPAITIVREYAGTAINSVWRARETPARRPARRRPIAEIAIAPVGRAE